MRMYLAFGEIDRESVGFPVDCLDKISEKPCIYAAFTTLSYYNALVNAADYACCFHVYLSFGSN